MGTLRQLFQRTSVRHAEKVKVATPRWCLITEGNDFMGRTEQKLPMQTSLSAVDLCVTKQMHVSTINTLVLKVASFIGIPGRIL